MQKLKDNGLYLAWVVTLAAGLPVFAWQAHRLRSDTPRLPEAAGPRDGECPGEAPPLRLSAIGESTVAGVGAPDHAHALAGQCALALSRVSGRAVQWRASGHNGATARQTRDQHVPAIDPQSAVVVVALGVNDVLSGCAPGNWRHQLRTLLAAIRRRAPQAVIAVSAVPPMGYFPAIPQPLRTMLGARARAFDRIAAIEVAGCPDALHVPLPFEGGGQFFCEDRFHPSVLGYARWGSLIGEATALRL